MTKKFLFVLIITTTILIGCRSTATPIPTATATSISETVINFLPPNFLFAPDKHSIELKVGIFAINKDVAFLFGKLDTQSTLLKSNDGGEHWVEVMKPVAGSSVIDFQMLETGEGWALILFFMQRPGNIYLFHTSDFGNTWKQIYENSNLLGDNAPANMFFIDSTQGQMLMYTSNSSSNRLDFLTTTDGGINWKESGSYSPPFDDSKTRYESAKELYYENLKDFSQSWGLDYVSHWKIETINKDIIISRQLANNNSWSNWEIINTIPEVYNYQNNQITIP